MEILNFQSLAHDATKWKKSEEEHSKAEVTPFTIKLHNQMLQTCTWLSFVAFP